LGELSGTKLKDFVFNKFIVHRAGRVTETVIIENTAVVAVCSPSNGSKKTPLLRGARKQNGSTAKKKENCPRVV
jgi:hypothetical protein